MIHALERFLEWGGVKKDVTCLVLSGIALLVSIFDLLPQLPFDAAWAAVILCGVPIVLEAVIGLVTAFDIKADVLVSIALIASLIIGEDFAAGEVAFIMQLGALLEDLTVARARAGIEKLVHLTPQTARRLTGGREEVIPAEQVAVGDVLRVLPGETVPVDGEILTGQTSINQAVMTGESLPVDKGPGDEVSSGTVNQFGAFEMRATKVGEDSSIQRMIRLVQSADAGKARIVGLADRWATWIVVAALTAAALTGLITRDPIRAVTILVVFCPCALVLATPTAIMAAIGNATKHSFLVREGDALERLASVSQVTFDKTGTLTLGTPQVKLVESLLPDVSRDALYAWTAGAELRSEHPLGRAVVQGWRAEAGAAPPEAADFQMLPGRGVSATVAGHHLIAGNRELLTERNIPWEPLSQAAAPAREQGCTVIYIAVDGRPAGFLALADTLRPDAAQTIRNVQAAGVTPVLLTGDHEKAARHIAGELGISAFQAECLPEDKLAWIDRSQQTGKLVCMVGDGINDAPALARADVGLAIGAGTDVAIESADIVLMKSDLMDAVAAVELSRATIRNIKENLFWAFFYNSIGIPLAAGVFYALGITDFMLNPMFGAAAMSLSSVCVVTNALRLRFFKSKFRTQSPQSQQTENIPGASAGDDRAPAPVCDQSCPVQLEESNQTTQGGTETMTKTLNIEGMMCAHCVAHVEKALSALGGVTSAKADLENKCATVTLAAPVSDQELKDAVTEAGYEVVSIQ